MVIYAWVAVTFLLRVVYIELKDAILCLTVTYLKGSTGSYDKSKQTVDVSCYEMFCQCGGKKILRQIKNK